MATSRGSSAGLGWALRSPAALSSITAERSWRTATAVAVVHRSPSSCPRTKSAAEAPEAPNEPIVQERSKIVRLLLVEDHTDTARILARLLRKDGYHVQTAHSATAALELASATPFDLLVSDVGLPDATGYELMHQLKARYGLKGIAMTGYGMEEDLRKGREAGFSEHLVKPIDVARLQEAIRRVSTRSD